MGSSPVKTGVNTSENEERNRVSETEKKILEEMYELEEKHFGENKKAVQIDINL